jgi:hypothetical protein
MEISINTDDLLKWARAFDEVPKHTHAAIARALNAIGAQIERGAAEYVAEQSDLDPNDVMGMIDVTMATPDDLTWEMNATAVSLQQQEWSKPWDKSGDHSFDQTTLLNIITCGDGKVCEICQEASEGGPYSAEEIQNLALKWANYVPPASVTGVRTNLLHPNCRCSTQQWRSLRKTPVTFGKTGASPPELLTARQIGRAVAVELKSEIDNLLKVSELSMDYSTFFGGS